jgi:hypothetical protein
MWLLGFLDPKAHFFDAERRITQAGEGGGHICTIKKLRLKKSQQKKKRFKG